MRLIFLVMGVCIIVFGLLAYNLSSNMVSFNEKSDSCELSGGFCHLEKCDIGYQVYDKFCEEGVCCIESIN